MIRPPCDSGFYGKLPAKGDFVTRRLPPDFVGAWDAWLQDGLTASRERLGESWLDAYLIAPVWRFVLPAGLLDPRVVAGILMPSIDRAGRYFPLTVAAMVAGPVSPVSLAAAAENWFTAAEELAIMALEDGLDFDRFDQEVAALGLPALQPAATSLRRSPELWMVPVGAGTSVASAMTQIAGEVLGEALGACSVWWTSGSGRVAPSLVVRQGMPAAAEFPALMDGLWLPAGETAPEQPGGPEETT
jgi:type VI secretion system protein ImpM